MAGTYILMLIEFLKNDSHVSILGLVLTENQPTLIKKKKQSYCFMHFPGKKKKSSHKF